MGVKLNRLACAGQGQVVSVERANASVVERVIVKPAKSFPTRVIQPYPFLEPFLDPFLLLPGSLSRLCIHNRFLLIIEIKDRGCFEIEGIFNEFEAGISVRAPIGRIGGGALCLPVSINVPGSERVNVSNFHAGRYI